MASHNIWKYSTIGLLAIIVVGISFPHASAATDVSNLVQQILNIVKSPTFGNQAIMNAISGLQGSAATGNSVQNLQDSVDDLEEKIDALSEKNQESKIAGFWHLATTQEGIGLLICNSDRDYKLYVYSQDDLDQDNDFIDVGPPTQRIRGDESYQVLVPADAGTEIRIDKNNEGDSGMNVYVVMETSEDATSSGCAQ